MRKSRARVAPASPSTTTRGTKSLALGDSFARKDSWITNSHINNSNNNNNSTPSIHRPSHGDIRVSRKNLSSSSLIGSGIITPRRQSIDLPLTSPPGTSKYGKPKSYFAAQVKKQMSTLGAIKRAKLLAESQMQSAALSDSYSSNSNLAANQTALSRLSKKLKNINKILHRELAVLDQHKPIFSSWIVFTQLLVFIVMLSTRNITPVTFKLSEKTKIVGNRLGTYSKVSINTSTNAFVGPSDRDLISLGAKFPPCMRKDKRIFEDIVDPQRSNHDVGCCINADQTCYTAVNRSQCSFGFIQSFVPGLECHSQICCIDPKQTPPFCEIVNAGSVGDDIVDSCTCDIIARPCCIGIYGECMVETKEFCDFVGGKFHQNEATCATVNCFEGLCGLSGFSGENPDQWYRLIISLVMHSGLVHCLFSTYIEWALCVEIERSWGTTRTAFIFFSSGIIGYLVSSIATPYAIETGPAGSMFGLIGCHFVILFSAWKDISTPKTELLKLLIVSALNLFVGMMPYINNFSHVGGFAAGILASMAVIPDSKGLAPFKMNRAFIVLTGYLGTMIMFVVLLPVFFSSSEAPCDECHRFNCLEILPGMDSACEDTGREPKTNIYSNSAY